MSTLPDPSFSGNALEPVCLSVTQLTQAIKGALEPSFRQVWVVGEVSNYRPATSGHAYFSLKDAEACVATAFFGWASRKKFELQDGMRVLGRGRITVYAPRGNYQLVLDHLEPLGAGALQLAFEKLKAKLLAEGLFDAASKRALPSYPSRLVVITSSSAAAFQDVLSVLKRRAPHMHIILVPSLVQGAEASTKLIESLEIANRYALGDAILLTRGGGSIEDLWCFNSELLARAIHKSQIPLISAIGHEIDFTIADFVADVRAPTPSAAAEILSASWVQASHRLEDGHVRLKNGILRDLSTKKVFLQQCASRLISPKDRLRDQAQRLDEVLERLARAMATVLQKKGDGLARFVSQLDALSPLRVLERGYSLVREASTGEVVRSAHQWRPGMALKVTFFDGDQNAQAL